MNKVYILFETKDEHYHEPETEILGVYSNYYIAKAAMVVKKQRGIDFVKSIGCSESEFDLKENGTSYVMQDGCGMVYYKLWIEEHKIQN